MAFQLLGLLSNSARSIASVFDKADQKAVMQRMLQDIVNLRNTVDSLVTSYNQHAHADDGAEHATGTVTPTVLGIDVDDTLVIDVVTLTAKKHHSFGTVTITAAGVDVDDTYTLNGYAFTAKAAEDLALGQFDTSGTDTAAAASLAACINASVDVLIAGLVTAYSAAGVVYVRKVSTGIATYTHVSSDAQLAVSGAGTLTAGTVPAAGEFDISGTIANCCDSIVEAIEASATLMDLLTVDTSATVVTMTALEFGASGNAIVLTSSDAQLAVSGSGTFSGGATLTVSQVTGPSTVGTTL